MALVFAEDGVFPTGDGVALGVDDERLALALADGHIVMRDAGASMLLAATLQASGRTAVVVDMSGTLRGLTQGVREQAGGRTHVVQGPLDLDIIAGLGGARISDARRLASHVLRHVYDAADDETLDHGLKRLTMLTAETALRRREFDLVLDEAGDDGLGPLIAADALAVGGGDRLDRETLLSGTTVYVETPGLRATALVLDILCDWLRGTDAGAYIVLHGLADVDDGVDGRHVVTRALHMQPGDAVVIATTMDPAVEGSLLADTRPVVGLRDGVARLRVESGWIERRLQPLDDRRAAAVADGGRVRPRGEPTEIVDGRCVDGRVDVAVAGALALAAMSGGGEREAMRLLSAPFDERARRFRAAQRSGDGRVAAAARLLSSPTLARQVDAAIGAALRTGRAPVGAAARREAGRLWLAEAGPLRLLDALAERLARAVGGRPIGG